MTNPDRLTGLDASFLALEDTGAHMHVGSCVLFEGRAPEYDEFVSQLESRMHLVPRYRQKLARPPLAQARPVWVDDPHFNAGYHVRHTALPEPASLEQLRNLTGRVLAQRLDRTKPLWEIWLVDQVEGGRFALITKTHHCLVDGISGVDIATVLFDLEPDPPPPLEPPPAWSPRPEPSTAALIADSVTERASGPWDAARAATGAIAHPERTIAGVVGAVSALGSVVAAGLQAAPSSPYNAPIGPHRRFAWVDGELDRFKAIKGALGGTVNDVVLTAVTGALRAHMIANGHRPDDAELKAMVPMSVRSADEHGALGNRVTTMYAPLPVHAADVIERFAIVHESMADVKESGQAMGAELITQMTGFAPPTLLTQAARLQSRQRMFNLTVTNVPGPQFPLFLLGRRLLRLYPQVPLARNTALGIAIMSYNGTINFGLLADYDALPDLDALADMLRASIQELEAVAGLPASNGHASSSPGARSAVRR